MQELLRRYEKNNPAHSCTAGEFCNLSSDKSDKRLTNGACMVGDDMTDRYMSTGVCKVKENALKEAQHLCEYASECA